MWAPPGRLLSTHRAFRPAVPAEPRLLVDPPEPQKLSKFFVTQMERDKHHDLYVDPDRIIPLPLMAPEMYAVRPGAALDPADKALVAAAIEGSQKASPAPSAIPCTCGQPGA